jgi:hypothetical protein
VLRQQTASVASTTSSTSTSALESTDASGHVVQGTVPSTSSRRHRSSSNLSAHSVGLGGLTAVSGIAPARDVPNVAQSRNQLHRQDSVASRRSEALSASSSFSQSDGFQGGVSLRQGQTGLSSGPPSAGVRPVSPTETRHPQRTTSSSSSRVEEITHQRAELEKVRQENEALRRRIQELEHRLSPHSGRTTETCPEGSGRG